jgi:NADPH2:quinone reductase
MSVVSGQAWRADQFGAPVDVLSWQPQTWDAPPDDAVLVEVLAAGVGLPDLFMLQGSYPLVRTPPITPGQEVCGRVIAVAGRSSFSVGDRICGPTHFHKGAGGFATHTYVSESQAMLAPASISDDEAAGFSIGFRTAHTALVIRTNVQAGESVLVLGGSGGTGASAISLAKALGAHVVAVASTDEKREFCRSLGAAAVVDRTAEAVVSAAADHTEGKGFDVVIDPVGGDIANTALKTVARYGRFAAVGFASGSWVAPNGTDMAFRNYSVVGVLAAGFTAEENRRAAEELTALADAGSIRTPVGYVAPMSAAPETIESLAGGAPPGKLILTPLLDA